MTVQPFDKRRIGACALLFAMALSLGACILAPGKFISSLDIRKNGTFTFAYKGEISMLGLAQIAAMNKSKAAEAFTAIPCYSTSGPVSGAREAAQAAAEAATSGERKCTETELAQQRQDWQEQRKLSAEREKKELDQLKAALGGLDPTDPKSIDEFATRLRRQAGWNAVTYKGDGLFDADYALTGKLDHDFVFPVIERFPTMNTFVQVLRRTDGTVRVDAPGFVMSQSNNPMMAIMGMRGMGASASDQTMPKFSQIDGNFSLTTDGRILANNTDDGPQADPQGQRLSWAISPRTPAAPTALIRLGN